ncbi:unnamed protein product [Rotaria sp. Silwood1]|nr:unnamed protein product [Rotaria sp. Silwood1]CAF0859274.1 unnamed protein product [Rotaria sp. Silwood1]CAF3355215.1 unnamed protein product [Rotaria sp. Silwood1]CAF3382409.1 unnamed protein product [Rotaria sp. Silwood1]CAF4536913.1 unnamed protein product [Rotaria sp. Silwood1]
MASSAERSHGHDARTYYNSTQEHGLDQRNESKILHLRNFNNWIKSTLIDGYLQRIRKEQPDRSNKIHVFDMGCGKGGDQLKWQVGRVNFVTFADLAENSVEVCKQRYYERQKKCNYNADFFPLDCTKELIRNKLKTTEPCFDLVSTQFVLHYAFDKLESANRFLRNAAEFLRVGGYFIGTTVNSCELVERCRNSPNQSISNDVFNVAFDPSIDLSKTSNESIPLFGAKYHFTLDDVVNCPEYLVYFPLLEELAKKHGLKKVERQTFKEYFDNNKDTSGGRFLLSKMNALEYYELPPDNPHNQRGPIIDHTRYTHAAKYINDVNTQNQNSMKSCRTLSKQEWDMTIQQSRSKVFIARPTLKMTTRCRTTRRQTTYLSIPSTINGNIKGGQVLAVGENGMTQLGLKSSIDQRKNPQPVLISEPVVQIAAGPLHSVCLTNQNDIYTFGCNDEYALGRSDNNNDDNNNDADPFGKVDLTKVLNIDQENIVQIVAGDSHTLVLSNMGKVYGSSHGIYGLVRNGKMAKHPIEIPLPEKIVKLASGYDFILFLSETGHVYSCGNGETGQLGRVSRYVSEDGGRRGIERLITPAPILYNRSSIKDKNLLFEDIFTGAHHYFLKVQGQSYILAAGLNNFHQIGLSSTEPVFFPTHIPSLDGYQWKKFAGGLHHTLGLTIDGEVYAMGRCHEGQLGIDALKTHVDKPTLIPNIPKAVDIACGNHVSFIIDKTGKVYSFGTGTSLQHGHGENDIKMPRMMSSKFMDIKKITNIAVGAQHTIFLTKE